MSHSGSVGIVSNLPSPPFSPRVLLFGASGYVGRQIMAVMEELHIPYLGVIDKNKSYQDFVDNDFSFVAISYEDGPESLLNHPEVWHLQPNTMVDLSWWGVSGNYRNDPRQLDNVSRSARNVLLAQKLGISRILGCGSQAEYGQVNGAISEKQPELPETLYGIAKVAAKDAAQHIARLAKMKFIWVRIFSVYGPDSTSAWLVPSLIRSISQKEKYPLTKGEQKWDYLHVRDCAEAIVSLILDHEAEGVFNVGSGVTTEIREIVSLVRDLVDPTYNLELGSIEYRPDQVMHLEADISKIVEQTGWRPKLSLREGLEATVKACLKGGKA